MLRTRLWMGAFLIALVIAVLWIDPAPGYPLLLLLLLILGLLSSIELHRLIGAAHGISAWQMVLSPLLVLLSGWPVHWLGWGDPWLAIVSTFILVVVVAFLVEMARFRGPEAAEKEFDLQAARPAHGGRGGAVVRIALISWATAYIGLLGCFVSQVRWLASASDPSWGRGALLLAILVPKTCDIGAYFTGRLVGRHAMTPVLSPKKTWEGLAGGLLLSMGATVAINRILSVLPGGDVAALGFGLSVGLVGALGDLAESLIKRDCQQKDASTVVPGFGGVLDVIDAILFAAPLAYLWLRAS